MPSAPQGVWGGTQAAHSSPEKEVLERLSGPAGAAARYAAWDSGLLELQRPQGGRAVGRGNFSLELWRFFEAWRLPELPEPNAAEAAEQATPGDESFRPSGKPRASVLHREETRVTYSGTFEAREVPALRLAGFGKAGLNQAYVEQPELQIAGLSTWWSTDGRYFIYFAEEYGHWKLNSLRAAGGDGMRAVLPKNHRSGRGFAHSGGLSSPTGERKVLAREALLRADGWFEVSDGEWEPLQVQVSMSKAWSMELNSSSVAFEELLVHGEDKTREQRSGGPCQIRGLRPASAASGPLLLFLPALPDAEAESKASDAVVLAGEEPVEEGEEEEDEDLGSSGDPDLMLLEPMREAKL